MSGSGTNLPIRNVRFGRQLEGKRTCRGYSESDGMTHSRHRPASHVAVAKRSGPIRAPTLSRYDAGILSLERRP